MRHVVVAALALGLFPALAGAAGPVAFSGSIWEGGKVAMEFANRLAPGERATMVMKGGRTIEMTVDDTGQAVVRLLGPDGGQLHSTVSPPGTASEKSFMYALCSGGRIAFTSPRTPGATGCGSAATMIDTHGR